MKRKIFKQSAEQRKAAAELRRKAELKEIWRESQESPYRGRVLKKQSLEQLEEWVENFWPEVI